MLAHRWAANSQEDPDKTTRPPGQNTFAPDELEEKNTSKKDTERGVTKTLLKFLFQRFFLGGGPFSKDPRERKPECLPDSHHSTFGGEFSFTSFGFSPS